MRSRDKANQSFSHLSLLCLAFSASCRERCRDSIFQLARFSAGLDHYSSRQSIKMLQRARTSEEPPTPG